MTHPALSEADLYDDPNVGQQIIAGQGPAPPFSGLEYVPQPPPQKIEDTAKPKPTGPKPKSDAYLAAVSAAMDILSYRIILLLSVLVAGGLFGLATWEPDPWRLGAAAAYSVIVVVPLTFFYARR